MFLFLISLCTYFFFFTFSHKIVAMHLSTPSHQSKVPMTNATGFKSRVVVQHMESGPSPDTASFVQKIEEEKLAKERGETKDNRSFFAKYV